MSHDFPTRASSQRAGSARPPAGDLTSPTGAAGPGRSRRDASRVGRDVHTRLDVTEIRRRIRIARLLDLLAVALLSVAIILIFVGFLDRIEVRP